ncbi:hypothetical protein O181_071253 [Austropuccinia psidii MF-1]|uniref:Uncharacterized protein n=1 Tax=Austropuccinia psidii MF-1 TaxID=1389203 RepID=A0A9Q3F596_9BASI|nr:hypothetical protein [Austropuccinia psidii MF-1]
MHVKDNCSKIPPHQKSRYIQEVLQMMVTTTRDSEDISLAGSFTGTTTSRSTSVSTPGQQPSSASYFRCISNDCTIKIHELLLKALIISNIPFRFLDNKYFQEYQRALVRSPYKLPTRD